MTSPTKAAELAEKLERYRLSPVCDNGTDLDLTLREAAALLRASEGRVPDVRCEGCGYMTHHREHMGCVRAAKQLTAAPHPPAQQAEPEFCPRCGGSGESTIMENGGPDAQELPCVCPHCNGGQTLEAAYRGVVALLEKEHAKYIQLCGKLYFSPATPHAAQQADEDPTTREQYRRMFGAACEALGAINEALGLDPDDGGAEPILDAIEELKTAQQAEPADECRERCRLPEAKARAIIEAWLKVHAPGFPDYSLCEDGDDGWAFWMAPHDTTSYVHWNGKVEWYGTGWPEEYAYRDDGEWVDANDDSESVAPLTVIDPNDWEPCTPEFLLNGGVCDARARLWNPVTCNHWHPKRASPPPHKAEGAEHVDH